MSNKIKKGEFKVSIEGHFTAPRVRVENSDGNYRSYDFPEGVTLYTVSEGQLLDLINSAKDKIKEDIKEHEARAKVEAVAYKIANPRK